MRNDRYLRGIIFSKRVLEAAKGFNDIEEDVHLFPLARLILKFLTTDIRNVDEAREKVDNDIDELVHDAGEIGCVSSHIVENEDSCLKLTNILICMCHSMLLLFEDCGFYNDCKSNLIGRPTLVAHRNKRDICLYVRKRIN